VRCGRVSNDRVPTLSSITLKERQDEVAGNAVFQPWATGGLRCLLRRSRKRRWWSGRRGGKSRVLAFLGTALATSRDYGPYLVAGEAPLAAARALAKKAIAARHSARLRSRLGPFCRLVYRSWVTPVRAAPAIVGACTSPAWLTATTTGTLV
jgi:hypothetical protein